MIEKSLIQLPNNKGIELIAQEKIICICSDDKYLDIFFDDCPKKTIRCSMANAEKILTHPLLVRIHNRYIVNLSKIEQIIDKYTTVTLANNLELPISRKYKMVTQHKLKGISCILRNNGGGGNTLIFNHLQYRQKSIMSFSPQIIPVAP